ncbi:hypothetical protein H4219_005810 [Mycoemilia scoparia]|uniref:DUF2423 domain-containing protein n=1 Tax=Mycoemilia scoparia TaxID=417184 RepID=A0A9W8DKC5_9FUNG|nr:hypothetical protein H4219_005810 [Mycoemilia scoparia]
MAKSGRSKSKIRSRNIRRENIYGPVEAERLKRLADKQALTKGTIEVEMLDDSNNSNGVTTITKEEDQMEIENSTTQKQQQQQQQQKVKILPKKKRFNKGSRDNNKNGGVKKTSALPNSGHSKRVLLQDGQEQPRVSIPQQQQQQQLSPPTPEQTPSTHPHQLHQEISQHENPDEFVEISIQNEMSSNNPNHRNNTATTAERNDDSAHSNNTSSRNRSTEQHGSSLTSSVLRPLSTISNWSISKLPGIFKPATTPPSTNSVNNNNNNNNNRSRKNRSKRLSTRSVSGLPPPEPFGSNMEILQERMEQQQQHTYPQYNINHRTFNRDDDSVEATVIREKLQYPANTHTTTSTVLKDNATTRQVLLFILRCTISLLPLIAAIIAASLVTALSKPLLITNFSVSSCVAVGGIGYSTFKLVTGLRQIKRNIVWEQKQVTQGLGISVSDANDVDVHVSSDGEASRVYRSATVPNTMNLDSIPSTTAAAAAATAATNRGGGVVTDDEDEYNPSLGNSMIFIKDLDDHVLPSYYERRHSCFRANSNPTTTSNINTGITSLSPRRSRTRFVSNSPQFSYISSSLIQGLNQMDHHHLDHNGLPEYHYRSCSSRNGLQNSLDTTTTTTTLAPSVSFTTTTTKSDGGPIDIHEGFDNSTISRSRCMCCCLINKDKNSRNVVDKAIIKKVESQDTFIHYPIRPITPPLSSYQMSSPNNNNNNNNNNILVYRSEILRNTHEDVENIGKDYIRGHTYGRYDNSVTDSALLRQYGIGSINFDEADYNNANEEKRNSYYHNVVRHNSTKDQKHKTLPTNFIASPTSSLQTARNSPHSSDGHQQDHNNRIQVMVEGPDNKSISKIANINNISSSGISVHRSSVVVPRHPRGREHLFNSSSSLGSSSSSTCGDNDDDDNSTIHHINSIESVNNSSQAAAAAANRNNADNECLMVRYPHKMLRHSRSESIRKTFMSHVIECDGSSEHPMALSNDSNKRGHVHFNVSNANNNNNNNQHYCSQYPRSCIIPVHDSSIQPDSTISTTSSSKQSKYYSCYEPFQTSIASITTPPTRGNNHKYRQNVCSLFSGLPSPIFEKDSHHHQDLDNNYEGMDDSFYINFDDIGNDLEPQSLGTLDHHQGHDNIIINRTSSSVGGNKASTIDYLYNTLTTNTSTTISTGCCNSKRQSYLGSLYNGNTSDSNTNSNELPGIDKTNLNFGQSNQDIDTNSQSSIIEIIDDYTDNNNNNSYSSNSYSGEENYSSIALQTVPYKIPLSNSPKQSSLRPIVVGIVAPPPPHGQNMMKSSRSFVECSFGSLPSLNASRILNKHIPQSTNVSEDEDNTSDSDDGEGSLMNKPELKFDKKKICDSTIFPSSISNSTMSCTTTTATTGDSNDCENSWRLKSKHNSSNHRRDHHHHSLLTAPSFSSTSTSSSSSLSDPKARRATVSNTKGINNGNRGGMSSSRCCKKRSSFFLSGIQFDQVINKLASYSSSDLGYDPMASQTTLTKPNHHHPNTTNDENISHNSTYYKLFNEHVPKRDQGYYVDTDNDNDNESGSDIVDSYYFDTNELTTKSNNSNNDHDEEKETKRKEQRKRKSRRGTRRPESVLFSGFGAILMSTTSSRSSLNTLDNYTVGVNSSN